MNDIIESKREMPAPGGVEVTANGVWVDGRWQATLAVTGYPAEVGTGWLEPLLALDGVDVSVHVEPIPAAVAAGQLKRQRARFESTRRLHADKGQLEDLDIEAAGEDAHLLAERVARAEERLFATGIYLTVHADTREGLASAVVEVRAAAAGLMMDVRECTFRALHGWITGLPLGVDLIGARRTMGTSVLATAAPFTAPTLPDTGTDSGTAVLLGGDGSGDGLVFLDRWAQDNHNSVILARSGAGKSYLAKLDLLRNLYHGVHAAVIDPDREYTALAQALGGAVIDLADPDVRLNPFDLPHQSSTAGVDGVVQRAMFAQTFITVLLGEPLSSRERAAVDRAVMAAYQRAGITTVPATWGRPAPLLADVTEQLTAGVGVGVDLAERLSPFVTGSHAGLFTGATTTRPQGHLVVFSLGNVGAEVKSAATVLVLDAIWRRVTTPRYTPTGRRIRQLVVIDEAWLLARDPAGAAFLAQAAKGARKHLAGLSVVTQDVADLLGTELGTAVATNSATQILLRQAPQTIDAVQDAFTLSAPERDLLLTARQGEGLLTVGGHSTGFHALASPREHALCLTGHQAETARS